MQKLEVSCDNKSCGASPKKEMSEERRALPEDEGELVRKYKAMHEEH